ncbi:phosphatidate cytidylyltransferase [Ligilactobacillus pobuzihii E100301 = KCTC 13174]|nr:phosphatidate cytidylyltransferase [Ligilactobacillus pobuzihii E100301 = KCTC 13174]
MALVIFIPLIFVGGMPFDILVVAMGLVAASELLMMKKKLLVSFEAIISYLLTAVFLVPSAWLNFLPQNITHLDLAYFLILLLLLNSVFTRNRFSFDDAGTLTIGSIYIGLGFHYMMGARQNSIWMIFFALFIVWITDSGAYLIGRKLGKHKLAPNISPNKTWEGSIGGTIATVIIVGLYVFFLQEHFTYSLPLMLLMVLILSIAGQFGDLAESAYKRYFDVKDSGKILPGHGGILDRFDSILFVLPLMHFCGLL